MVHKKIIDYSQENQQSYPVKTFLFLESNLVSEAVVHALQSLTF